MTGFNYKAGINKVGQYQMSGIPFATASFTVADSASEPTRIDFPTMTRFVTIRNTMPTGSADRTLRVGFSSNGTKGVDPSKENYFTLANGESYTGEWRVQSLYILSDSVNESSASVIAGLTHVSTGSFSWTGSLGVG